MGVFKKIKTKWNNKFLTNEEKFKKQGGTIGDNCVILDGVSFGSEPYLITIGNNVRIGIDVRFITHDGGVWVIRKLGWNTECDLFGKISVGDNTHIGTSVIIMPGVNIGKNCVIGCGAVVTKDIPDNSIAAGVPARIISTIEQYYEKNKHLLVPTKNLSPDEKKDFLLKNNIFK